MSLEDPRPYSPDVRPEASQPRAARPTLGPGYDWLLEFLRQSGRPLAFGMCIVAGFYQIFAPPALRLDGLTFGLFIGLLGALCGLRSVDIANARNSLAPA